VSTYAAEPSPSPLAALVDETRAGSAGSQLAIGIAGVVLAVVLVMGQISLATTKGMAIHLAASVDNITRGNEVMESVIERAAPSVELEKLLAAQSQTLASTRDAMVLTNRELEAIAAEQETLVTTVDGMQQTSAQLDSDVASLSGSTAEMTSMLGTLPDATARTHKQLHRINTDTNAINQELAAIGRKMLSYGLPRAKGAPVS
jgi:septal ring factor EnvC (AmiA/AmiB activator)